MTTSETQELTNLKLSDLTEDDDEIKFIELPNNSNSNSDSESNEDDDEPPNYPPKFTCNLCNTQKPVHDTFRVKGCAHFYCSTCISLHVTKKIQENVTMVTCPVSGCEGVLEMESCKEVLERGVYERWGDALCESVIGDEGFHCPFENCGALLINDGGVLRESECPYCWRLFCVNCRVPWHVDVDCATFQMRI